MKHIRIVLIDDEAAIRTICKSYLQDIENVVVIGEAENVDDAEIIINACNPDLILLDIQLGKKTGFDLLARFSNPSFKVIISNNSKVSIGLRRMIKGALIPT